MKKTCFIFVCVLFGFALYAEPGIPAQGTSVQFITGYIKGFYQKSDGSFNVKIDDTRSPSYGGTGVIVKQNTAEHGFIFFPLEYAGRKELLAQLMLAKAMDWKVDFRLDPVTNSTSDLTNMAIYIQSPEW